MLISPKIQPHVAPSKRSLPYTLMFRRHRRLWRHISELERLLYWLLATVNKEPKDSRRKGRGSWGVQRADTAPPPPQVAKTPTPRVAKVTTIGHFCDTKYQSVRPLPRSLTLPTTLSYSAFFFYILAPSPPRHPSLSQQKEMRT